MISGLRRVCAGVSTCFLWVACAALLVLPGCASLAPTPTDLPALEWRSVPPAPAARPLLAVALSSGALRGYAHIGVMRAFENAGIQPDIIVGTSAGALVGSLWAAGLTSHEVEAAASELGMNVFADWAPAIGRLLFGSMKGLVEAAEMDRFIGRHVPARLMQDLPRRFAVVAADLQTGQAVAINGGPLARAVRASAGVPVVMEPVRAIVAGRATELVDGGLVEPVPVKTARRMGAQLVVAVDVVYRPSEAEVGSVLDVTFQAVQIAVNALRDEQVRSADLRISPDIHPHEVSTAHAKELIAAGERAAVPVVAELKTRLGRQSQAASDAEPASKIPLE